MVVLVCQEKKRWVLLCRLSMQGWMHCFKTQMGTGKFKRIIHQFSFSGKRRKEAFSWTLICPQGLQPGWFLHGGTLVLFWKETKATEFSRTICTLMVKEVPFLNGNLSIYSCFIDVLYDLRRILALTFDVFGRFYLRERVVKWSTIQLVLRELLLRTKLCVFEWNVSINNFSDYCFLYVHS